jgi:EAL domain-containing protein (putative c-di-GMP-specific phosphodiesterase class I)
MTWQRQFPERSPLFVSVNLSVIQLSQPDLLRQIDEILRYTGLPPSQLKLEITESAAMENAQRVIKILEQLKARQIRLSIDDFGTGYSSLSYLHSFPIDMLKVDRSFVMHIEDQSKNLEVVQTIIRLAHGLGMEAIAEGIETPQQLDFLKTLGCEYGQGYLFARPMQPEAIAKMLAQAAPVIDNPSTIREGV